MNLFSHSNQAGFTFFEVLAASMIASFVAGGTLLAFVTAARITAVQNHAPLSEANSFAAQTIERGRNLVAADDPSLPNSEAAPAWVSDPFDAAPPGGTESILPAKRCFRVSPGCGGNCHQVEVQVCWNIPNSPPGQCNCP